MYQKYKFALLGTPISHSLSPEIHKIFADGCGISARDFEYQKIETDKEQLAQIVEKLTSTNYSGFNCTMPLKQEILKLINGEKSRQSEFLDVANTIKICDKFLNAYTTDGDGMTAGIKYNKTEINGKNIIVLGAGGSAKSVVLSLIENNAKCVNILNRSQENLDEIMRIFGDFSNITYDLLKQKNIDKYIENCDILINMSRLGMSGFEQGPDFDESYNFLEKMKSDACVVEAVYNPLKTRLLSVANENKLKTIDGFWMLVYQGVLAFEIWTDLKVPEKAIEQAHSLVKR